MRIVCISDTHEKHLGLEGMMPEGDVLVHAGDFTLQGEPLYVEKFNEWLGTLPYEHKIVIPGNHELTFEDGLHTYNREVAAMITNATLLNDSSAIIDGVKFWGSPITPFFCNWAFNRMRGAEIKEHWDLIPDDTDVLITHGPPMGIMDEVREHSRDPRTGERTVQDVSVGCADLYDAIGRILPKVHVFGHIHRGYGIRKAGETTFVNASTCDERYRPANAPQVVEI